MVDDSPNPAMQAWLSFLDGRTTLTQKQADVLLTNVYAEHDGRQSRMGEIEGRIDMLKQQLLEAEVRARGRRLRLEPAAVEYLTEGLKKHIDHLKGLI